MSDVEILKEVRAGRRNEALKQLYKEWPKVKSLIQKSSGNKEQAQEIFNDSLMLLMEKIEQSNFDLTSKLTSYLYGIARFLWMNELRKSKKTIELEWNDALIMNADQVGFHEEKEAKLNAIEKALEKISEKCRLLIELFYYRNESMKVIAEKLNFSSENSAKTQKYKCLEHANKYSVELLNAASL